MASPSAPNQRLDDNSSSDKDKSVSSSFFRAVCLDDWWLINAENDFHGRRLAIGGLESRERAVRVFCSAPIMKRYDAFTLETADGITVMIKGLINRSHTLQSGFPSEVCNHFLLGFPHHWEAYAEKFFNEESSTMGVSTSISDVDELSMASGSNSHCDLPVELERSLMRAYNRKKNISTNTVDNCHSNTLKSPTVLERPYMNSSPALMSSLEGALTQCEKSESEPQHEDNLDPSNVGLEDFKKIASEKDHFSSSSKLENEIPKGDSLKKVTNNVTDVASKDSVVHDSVTDVIDQAEQKLIADTIKDDTCMDHVILIGSIKGTVTPLKLKKVIEMETLNICSTISSRIENLEKNQKQDAEYSGRSKSELTKIVRSAVSPDFLVSPDEDGLSGYDGSNLVGSGHEEVVKECFPDEPDILNAKSLERSENCCYDATENATAPSAPEKDYMSPSKTGTNTITVCPSKRVGTRSRSRLKNQISDQKEILASECFDKNKNNETISVSNVSGNPDGENLAGRNPLSTNIIPSNCSGARTIGSLKNRRSSPKQSLASKFLVRNTNNNPSSVSDPSESPGGRQSAGRKPSNTLGLLGSGCQESTHEILVKGLDGSQGNCSASSIPNEIRKQSSRNFKTCVLTENSNLNASFRSPTGDDDVRHINGSKISVREEESNDKVGTSGKKAKRKLEYVTQVNSLHKERTKECSIVSPETLSFKRSRSGRLLLPTMHFWRNQIPIYNADGEITAIQEGLPLVVKSPKGSRSEPQKKRRQHV